MLVRLINGGTTEEARSILLGEKLALKSFVPVMEFLFKCCSKVYDGYMPMILASYTTSGRSIYARQISQSI